ncbi:uncharacterized protein LOC109856208 [Pseudomyrmex gracilis]|uniref:uncharacterized protein LOC109856208 n=1 Tax=Pseudomyrmex gracilis TaxID=219809 RepID=UPI000995D29F|nr:uncharacterized protein LOC109856208 [Pseudomyrmex gracilis]
MTVKQVLNPLFLVSSAFGLVTALEIEEVFYDIFSMSNLGCSIVACAASIILSVYNSKRFWTFLERLAAVDYTLAELGTPKTHKALRAYVKGMIIVWLMCSLIGNTLDIKWWEQMLNSRWYIIIPFVLNHVYHVNMIVDVLFLTLLWYIGTRFDEVNEHMRCLIQEKQILRHTGRKSASVVRQHVTCADNYKHVLWTSMHLHLELCQIARQLNALFGTQMTLEMIGYLTTVSRIFSFEVLHVLALDNKRWTTINWLAIQFWTSFFLIKVFYFNYTCETTSAKAKKIQEIINHMTNSFLRADIRDEFITRVVTFTIFMAQSMNSRK